MDPAARTTDHPRRTSEVNFSGVSVRPGRYARKMGARSPTEAAALAEASAGALRRVIALVESGALVAEGAPADRLVQRLWVSAEALDRIALIHRREARSGRRLSSAEMLDLLKAES